MTAPATLLVQHPTWDEAIELTRDDGAKWWGDGRSMAVTVEGVLGYRGCAFATRPTSYTGLFGSPQAAADALANLIETTPELASLRPRSTS